MRAVAVAQNMGARAELTLITTGPGKMDKLVTNAGVELCVLHSPAKRTLHFMRAVRRIQRTHRFDVIHVHGGRMGPIVRLALLGCAPPMICTFHGHEIRNIWFHWLNFFVFKRIICVSAELHDFTRRHSPWWYHSRLRTVLNGVDSKRILSGQNRGVLRRELNLTDEHFLIGMVGNISSGRNFAMVCRTLPGVFAAIPNARFVFVGGVNNQPMKDEMDCIIAETGIGDRVFFTGPRAEVPDIMQELDLYVYSSVHDTFGLTIIEAMMAGLPVVVNDLPVFNETTDNGRYVEYYRTNDQDDLLRAIVTLAQDPVRMKKLATDAREWAMSHFDFDIHIENLLRQYREVAAIYKPKG